MENLVKPVVFRCESCCGSARNGAAGCGSVVCEILYENQWKTNIVIHNHSKTNEKPILRWWLWYAAAVRRRGLCVCVSSSSGNGM